MAPIFALSKVEGPAIPPLIALANTQRRDYMEVLLPAAATGGILADEIFTGRDK